MYFAAAESASPTPTPAPAHVLHSILPPPFMSVEFRKTGTVEIVEIGSAESRDVEGVRRGRSGGDERMKKKRKKKKKKVMMSTSVGAVSG